MIYLHPLSKPNANEVGFTYFQLPSGELRRVDMNPSRTGSSAIIYFDLAELRRYQIATLEPRSEPPAFALIRVRVSALKGFMESGPT